MKFIFDLRILLFEWGGYLQSNCPISAEET